MRYIAYSASNGRILRYGQCRSIGEDGGADFDAQAQTGEAVMPYDLVPKADVQYVAGGLVTDRPACPVTSSVAGRVVTLNGVPVGVPYTVTSDTAMTSDSGTTGASSVSFQFDTAGHYVIEVDCFPAQLYHGEFTLG